VTRHPFGAFFIFDSLWTDAMNRCTSPAFFRHAAALLLGLSAAWAGVAAYAQTDGDIPGVRNFPPTALRGKMVVRTPPEITMDGKADRLSPGARIRDASNQFILTEPLVGQPVVVNYLRDNIGQVQQVWILNADEAALRRPNSPKSFFDSLFGSSAPAGPVDNGRTPYNQLPPYKP
jgi:hypothetical protein